MSRRIVKGEISEKRSHYHQIEWTIENIFSYTQVNKYFFSPQFSILGAEWRLKLYPYGETRENSKGCMDLYLEREDACTSPRSVNWSFGIKKRDGTVEMVEPEESDVFDKGNLECGYYSWFERSELRARKSELAPSGDLTVICSIRTDASLETATGLNELEYLDTTPVISWEHSSIPLNPESVFSSPVETVSCQERPRATTGLQHLSDALKNMFLSSRGCDTILKVRKEEFPVHRSILASRSPVFEAMFEADMKEKNTGLNSESVFLSGVGTASSLESPSATTEMQKLSDDLKSVFLSSEGCDAPLKLQKEEFPVHRSILASRSPVFEAMFEADMKENNTGVVDIVDCHPGAFKDFLIYIYSGKFENSSGEIFELYSISHKYDVEPLKSDCVAFIMENLTVENVIDAYSIGHHFQEEELKKKSQDFFKENFSKIISNDKWVSFLKEKPILANMLLKGMTENTEIKTKEENLLIHF